jgi:hypothetical protein
MARISIGFYRYFPLSQSSHKKFFGLIFPQKRGVRSENREMYDSLTCSKYVKNSLGNRDNLVPAISFSKRLGLAILALIFRMTRVRPGHIRFGRYF